MKRILILQIVINIVGLLVFILFFLGKMVDFKYNYEDPMVKADATHTSDFLHSALIEFGVLLLVIIVFNLAISIILKRGNSGNNSK